jgi:DedD protein
VKVLAILTLAKNPVADDEIQLRKRARRRLVGATALVLVAIVVLPMVLDSEPRQSQHNIDIVIPPIPPQETGPEPPPPSPAATDPAAGTLAQHPAAPEAASAEPDPAPPPAPKPPPAPADVAVQAKEGGYVIQIGCFSDPAKARGLVSRIESRGFPAFSARAPNANCTRVRAGPFSTQRSAEKGRDRLRKLGMIPPPSEGKIVSRGD